MFFFFPLNLQERFKQQSTKPGRLSKEMISTQTRDSPHTNFVKKIIWMWAIWLESKRFHLHNDQSLKFKLKSYAILFNWSKIRTKCVCEKLNFQHLLFQKVLCKTLLQIALHSISKATLSLRQLYPQFPTSFVDD